MAAVIVPFDVIEVDCVRDTPHLVELAKIVPEIWIIGDAP